jgi:hypothetical protein
MRLSGCSESIISIGYGYPEGILTKGGHERKISHRKGQGHKDRVIFDKTIFCAGRQGMKFKAPSHVIESKRLKK